MKRLIFSILLLSTTFALTAFYTKGIRKSSGAHPGSTGAPGDLTCSQYGCHADATVKPGDDVNSLAILSLENATYEPGKTYNVKLRVQDAQAKSFGFQIVALNKDNTKAGRLGVYTVDNPKRTQLQTQDGREYLTHVSSSITPKQAGSNEWQFTWTAPANYSGPVTFYYATNATNGDLASTGDRIYLSSLTINGSTTGIEETMESAELRCEPNPATNELSIFLPTATMPNAPVSIRLFDMKGKEVQNFSALHSTVQPLHVGLSSEIPSGVYILRVSAGNTILTKKVIINR